MVGALALALAPPPGLPSAGRIPAPQLRTLQPISIGGRGNCKTSALRSRGTRDTPLPHRRRVWYNMDVVCIGVVLSFILTSEMISRKTGSGSEGGQVKAIFRGLGFALLSAVALVAYGDGKCADTVVYGTIRTAETETGATSARPRWSPPGLREARSIPAARSDFAKYVHK